MSSLRMGAASRIINNQVNRPVQGASVDKQARYVRDNCEANALFVADDHAAVLLVSCDLVGLERSMVAPVCQELAARTTLEADSIIIAATHMHSGPSLLRTNYLKAVDGAYVERLQEWLVQVGEAACASAGPARLTWGLGHARIGYNRRCCWSDGSHSMHGNATRPDFAGLEGPDDPAHLALLALSQDDALLAVAYNNSSHPTCFYGADFYSADFPGTAREQLRTVLGNIPVLFLNGAFGDLAIDNQLTRQNFGETREQRLMRAAHLVTGETLRLLHEPHGSTVGRLAHRCLDLPVAVRLPTPENLQWARETLGRVDAGEEVPAWDRLRAYGMRLLYDEFAAAPQDTLRIHAIRLGELALVTQPCELYCQFGLDIKRRSPADATGVVGIADGYSGYCPTAYGPLGGGYSGEPLHWTRLADDAGYRIVDAAAAALNALWH